VALQEVVLLVVQICSFCAFNASLYSSLNFMNKNRALKCILIRILIYYFVLAEYYTRKNIDGGVGEQSAEEDVENYIMGIFIICTLHQILV
jgi:hypothetical protein